MTLRKKVYSMGAIGVLAAGMLFAAADSATNPHRRLDFLASKLNLTDAQKQSAQNIFAQSREAAKPIAEQLKQTREALTAAVKAGKSDAELNSLAAQQGALVGQLSAVRAKAFSKLYAQLTPEQRDKAEQMHQRVKGRFERHTQQQ
jgi:Spy/CpxP family protein refolding chaperone